MCDKQNQDTATTRTSSMGDDRLQELFQRGYEAGQRDSASQLEELFRYHAPTSVQIPKYGAVNQACINLAKVLEANCPAGGDHDFAMLLLRLTRMMANASIALDRSRR